MRHPAEPVDTDRLRLLPWSGDDLEPFAALCSDAGAMRFISRGRPLPREAIDEIHRRAIASWSEHGVGPWAAVEKRSGHWIGRVGLSRLADWPGPDRWEVGFELVPSAWGCGYATEGARRAVQFAWERTSLDRVISVTVPDHAASRRVMEKAGLAFQAEIDWRGATIVWYAVDRPGAM